MEIETIRKGEVFESKYDTGGEFEERLKLSRMTGHGQIQMWGTWGTWGASDERLGGEANSPSKLREPTRRICPRYLNVLKLLAKS